MTERYIEVPFDGEGRRWAGVLYLWKEFAGPRMVALDVTSTDKITVSNGDLIIYGCGPHTLLEAKFACVDANRKLIHMTYEEARELAKERGMYS